MSAEQHRGQLESYRAVVAVTPRSRRPIYRNRYIGSCSCGDWLVDVADYIRVKRAWKEHKRDG